MKSNSRSRRKPRITTRLEVIEWCETCNEKTNQYEVVTTDAYSISVCRTCGTRNRVRMYTRLGGSTNIVLPNLSDFFVEAPEQHLPKQKWEYPELEH